MPLYYVGKIPVIGPFITRVLLPVSVARPTHRWRVGNTFDLYSPKYSFHYDHVEVHGWYERADLETIRPVGAAAASATSRPSLQLTTTPGAEVPEEVACNLCGRSNPRLLCRLRDYRLQTDDREWTVVKCRNRGLAYLNPRPAREEISMYYPEAYSDERKNQSERYRRRAAIERVNLADWIVRAAHISGQIVAQFEKSGVAGVRRREDRQAA